MKIILLIQPNRGVLKGAGGQSADQIVRPPVTQHVI